MPVFPDDGLKLEGMMRYSLLCLLAALFSVGAYVQAAEPVIVEINEPVVERLGLFTNARQLLVQELRQAGLDTDSQVTRASDKVVNAVNALSGAESEKTIRSLETALSRGSLLFTKLTKQVREFNTAATEAKFTSKDRTDVARHFQSASRSAALCVSAAADGDNDTSERAAIDFQICLLEAQESAGILFNNSTLNTIAAQLEKIGSDKALGVNRYYQQIASLQTELLRKRYAAERGMILGHFATQTGPTQREELTVGYEHALDQLVKNTELLTMVKQEAQGVIVSANERKNKILEDALGGKGQPVTGASFLQTR